MRKASPYLVLLALTGGLLLTSGPAQAHNSILATVPADGATVTAPTDIVITTNDELLDLGGEAGGFAVVVSDESGAYYGDGCVTVDGTTVITRPTLGSTPGNYTVQYQLVSRDGHTITGEFHFDWAPTDVTGDEPAYANIPVCGVEQEPINTGEPSPSQTPTEAPSPGTPEPGNSFGEPNMTPIIIGVITIPVIIAAIFLLMRLLGSKTSEDHLN